MFKIDINSLAILISKCLCPKHFLASFQKIELPIDLVFYNSKLKSFLSVDLKIGKLLRQDVGQMGAYVRIYDEHRKGADDNPTIGLILCSEKNETISKYSELKDSKQLFTSKYPHYLPKEEELTA